MQLGRLRSRHLTVRQMLMLTLARRIFLRTKKALPRKRKGREARLLPLLPLNNRLRTRRELRRILPAPPTQRTTLPFPGVPLSMKSCRMARPLVAHPAHAHPAVSSTRKLQNRLRLPQRLLISNPMRPMKPEPSRLWPLIMVGSGQESIRVLRLVQGIARKGLRTLPSHLSSHSPARRSTSPSAGASFQGGSSKPSTHSGMPLPTRRVGRLPPMPGSISWISRRSLPKQSLRQRQKRRGRALPSSPKT